MKKLLSLVLAVLMVASVFVIPTFAETAEVYLDNLSAYGQPIYDASGYKTPTYDGTINENEYAGVYEYEALQLGDKLNWQYNQVIRCNKAMGYVDGAGNGLPAWIKQFYAQDANYVYLGMQWRNYDTTDGTGAKGFVAGHTGDYANFYVNFPSEFTASDANNYLVIKLSGGGAVTLTWNGITAPADATGLVAKSHVDRADADDNYLNDYEIALSKAKIAEIFGWNGKTNMLAMGNVYFSNTTGAKGLGCPSDMGLFVNTEAAAALEASSAAYADDTAEIAPTVGFNDATATEQTGALADVIPVSVKIPHKEVTLADLTEFGGTKIDASAYTNTTIDGVINSGEYAGSYEMPSILTGVGNNWQYNQAVAVNKAQGVVDASGNGLPATFTHYVSQNAENLYMALSYREFGSSTNPYAFAAGKSGAIARFYISCPDGLTAKDANKYLIITITGSQGVTYAWSDGSSTTGYNLVNAKAFDLADAADEYYNDCEISISKAKLAEIFGWNGFTPVLTMASFYYSGGLGIDSNMLAYRNTEAASALEFSSALLSGDTAEVNPTVHCRHSGGSAGTWACADAIPVSVTFDGEAHEIKLNELDIYGQRHLNATYKSPVLNGVVDDGEYADKYKIYYAGNKATGSNWDPYDVLVAHDINNIYLAVDNYSDTGATKKADAMVRFFINFPTEFTAKDANNYLIIELTVSSSINVPRASLSCVGDAVFTTAMQAKIDAIGTGEKLRTSGLFANFGTTTDLASAGSQFELALSKAYLMDMFGWNGESDMTLMTWVRLEKSAGTAQMDHGYQNEFAATALEVYSASVGDKTAVSPKVYRNNTFAPIDDVIPSIVSFKNTGATAVALNEIAGLYTSEAKLGSVKINEEFDASEYTGSYTVTPFAGNYTYNVHTASDVANLYLAISHKEIQGGDANNPTFGRWTSNRVRFYINFPTAWDAQDANNYLMISMPASTDWDTSVFSIKAVGSEEFVNDMNAKISALGSANLVEAGLITAKNVNLANDADSVTSYELALSKAKLKDIFGWDGQSQMTLMTWVKYGNGYSQQMDYAYGYGNDVTYAGINALATYYGQTVAPLAFYNETEKNLILAPAIVDVQEINGAMKDGGSIRISSTEATSGLRFASFWDNEFLASLGSEVQIGTLITPKAYLDLAGGVFTHAALNEIGKEIPYIEVVALDTFEEIGDKTFATYVGSIVSIKDNARDYAAIGYIKVGDTYYYTVNYVVRNISQVATLVCGDVKDEAQGLYKHLLSNGKYSKYTQNQYDRIAKYIVAA